MLKIASLYIKMNRVIFICGLFLFTTAVAADENVDGYRRKDGKYVQSHKRSRPDDRRYNNYNSEGRSNPYTGEKGTQRNEVSKNPARNKKHH